jgi:5-methylcytosine-specific restriction endonuclease McrA
LTIDHVVPRAQGGQSQWENCVLACVACNKGKADRTPEQAGMRLKHKAVKPTWNPLYAAHEVRIESWSKFASEAYWNVALER